MWVGRWRKERVCGWEGGGRRECVGVWVGRWRKETVCGWEGGGRRECVGVGGKVEERVCIWWEGGGKRVCVCEGSECMCVHREEQRRETFSGAFSGLLRITPISIAFLLR